jgi:hypothetical protein
LIISLFNEVLSAISNDWMNVNDKIGKKLERNYHCFSNVLLQHFSRGTEENNGNLN